MLLSGWNQNPCVALHRFLTSCLPHIHSPDVLSRKIQKGLTCKVANAGRGEGERSPARVASPDRSFGKEADPLSPNREQSRAVSEHQKRLRLAPTKGSKQFRGRVREGTLLPLICFWGRISRAEHGYTSQKELSSVL